MRYYIAKVIPTGEEHVVEANTRTEAFRAIGQKMIVIEIAKTAQVVKALEGGGNVLRVEKKAKGGAQ